MQLKLLIKQRVFSWTDSYDVYDEAGRTRYTVRAELLSLGHRIHVFTPSGEEVGAIRQKLFRLLPQFELELDGRIVGTVQKRLSFFHPTYTVDCGGWTVKGDCFGWDYDVVGPDGPAAHIGKELLSWGDAYTLEVYRPADELAALLVVIAIDAANCSDG